LKLTPCSLGEQNAAQNVAQTTPNIKLKSNDLIALIEWVRAFVGFEYAWEVVLLLEPKSAPPTRLGDSQQLGWSTWLGQTLDDKPVVGMVFEPEMYHRSC
jgi:predicted component of type VI protein secretion system